jgi:quinohemoprotein ethanol dehydrogenase
MRGFSVAIAIVFGLVLFQGYNSSSACDTSTQTLGSANVTDSQIAKADSQPENWLTYGRTYSEQRFSTLKAITDQNAGQLGLAWYFDLDTDRGQEATPLVVNGVMYFSTAWNKVFAPVKVNRCATFSP